VNAGLHTTICWLIDDQSATSIGQLLHVGRQYIADVKRFIAKVDAKRVCHVAMLQLIKSSRKVVVD